MKASISLIIVTITTLTLGGILLTGCDRARFTAEGPEVRVSGDSIAMPQIHPSYQRLRLNLYEPKDRAR
jgi:hypothetical protein